MLYARKLLLTADTHCTHDSAHGIIYCTCIVHVQYIM